MDADAALQRPLSAGPGVPEPDRPAARPSTGRTARSAHRFRNGEQVRRQELDGPGRLRRPGDVRLLHAPGITNLKKKLKKKTTPSPGVGFALPTPQDRTASAERKQRKLGPGPRWVDSSF